MANPLYAVLLIGLLGLVASAAPLLDTRASPDASASQTWDAIVVGAGTAGIIVAQRLNAAGKSVLLLEQGGPSYGVTGGTERPSWLAGTNLSRVDVPGLYQSIFSSPNSSLLCPANIVNAFAACTIGGNSAINAGLYFQPPASDYDTYYPIGWKSTDVANATQRLLTVQPASTVYSKNGQYYLPSGYDATRKWLVEGAGLAEVNYTQNPNLRNFTFGRTVWDYRNGQRGGPVTTYLQTALKSCNFTFRSGVRVQRIARSGATASGVVATVNGANNTFNLSPGGRVIVSGGALQSPWLLMNSGIGPTDILHNLTVANKLVNPSDIITNDAVGQGLFDNPNTFLEFASPSIQSYAYNYSDPIQSDKQLYLNSRSGPYSFASETAAFWGYVPNADGSQTGCQGTIGPAGYSGYNNASTITINIYGTSGMKSKGRVILSSDGNFTPGPDGNVYYSDPQDGQAIATFIHKIFQSLPASGLTPLNLAQNSTLQEIQTYITTKSAYAVGQVQHWTSSCRIGACVDINSTVIGTNNIHVVDASIIMPPTVNPQMTVMIAAEHSVERILALGK